MNKITTRQDFMDFFRDDEKLNLLTLDDKFEKFTQILPGQCDFTVELFDEIFSNYDIGHLKVIEIENEKSA